MDDQEDKHILDNEDMEAEERPRPTLVIISLISNNIYIHTDYNSTRIQKINKDDHDYYKELRHEDKLKIYDVNQITRLFILNQRISLWITWSTDQS